MDEDLDSLSREDLIKEVKKLRSAIRIHRDASGHALCWYHPALWSTLPERNTKEVSVPSWPQFMRGCITFRQSLDEQLSDAPRTNEEFKG